MAVMSATDRTRAVMYLLRVLRGVLFDAYDRPTIRAALDAADQWREDNAASFNSALPVGFRTTATPQEKGLVLVAAVLRNYGLARVQEDS